MTLQEITCNACNGTGHRPMSKQNARTLDVMRKLGPATVCQIRARLNGVTLHAAHKRLERLESSKLIRQVGKGFPARFEVV